jgi:hypothetical protein
MAKTAMIRVRVSAKEYESIRNNAAIRGFATVSAFLRSLALERDLWLEKKVQETYHLVKEISDVLKQKSQERKQVNLNS